MNRLFLISIALTCLAASSSCTTVEPWERGTMADYTMRPDRDIVADSLGEHVYFSREAAHGGRGIGGGGCGCN